MPTKRDITVTDLSKEALFRGAATIAAGVLPAVGIAAGSEQLRTIAEVSVQLAAQIALRVKAAE